MSSPHLDHIIILIPYASLSSLPAYFTNNFTITPGGRHADNKTENKLICFQDGSYIELIAFTNDDPANRSGHWWGEKEFGIIDFAFTHSDGDATVHFSELEKRLDAMKVKDEADRVEYQPPVAGGRTRPDGVDVKWEVTFPVVGENYQRGQLPFWCHDVTPREVRAPIAKANTTHPCGTTGVSELCVFVPEERVSVLLEAYSATLAAPAQKDVVEVEKLKTGFETKTRFVVAAPASELQREAMETRGGYLLGSLDLSSNGKKTRIDGAEGVFGIGGLYV